MKNEHEKNVKMAQEIGNLLPETKDKVEHYESILRAESDLLKRLNSRQASWFVKRINKCREKVEMVELQNKILNHTKIYESYLARKKRYENWLNEMSVEVNSKFDEVLKEAEKIKTNLRLMNALRDYKSRIKEGETLALNERVEFYLFLKQEIKNKKKHSNKGRRG